ncbi:BTB/POZ domain-containing protein [Rhizophagus clarus]|uniref:BTB/POZ domain-containing protein n=1 Tax=Rhizophagus clarus TaxID=94130 RepID=A0A8H3LQP6_9GLOM|nr:BTB/POZ domain-containing protein [Rhizophagus clarus]
MTSEHSLDLAKNLSYLLKDTSNCDAIIIVGEKQNTGTEEFKAHSDILSSRSAYFKRVFSPQWAKKEDGFFISNQPNISPVVFNILLNYIYSRKLPVNKKIIQISSLVDILIASDELELLDVYQEFEIRLRDKSTFKLPKDFFTLYQFRQDGRFANLYEVAIGLMCEKAKFFFNSKEFLRMEEKHLIQLLKRDDLKLEEIEIWDYLIKWGIENTDFTLDENSTSTDCGKLKNTLHNCIPYIRFSQMSPKVFNMVRKKYKNILPEDLVDDVLQYFSDPNSKSSLKNLPPRESTYPLDSKIIHARDVATISNWIDKKKEAPYLIKDIPFEFKLIYRASQEGFNTNKFHEFCDNKGPTVVIAKVRNSGEIIGGYNSLDWCSFNTLEKESYINYECEIPNSFIFSLRSLSNGVFPILSRVTSKEEAIIWCKNKGPCFGVQDLWIQYNSRTGISKQKSYENKIIDSKTFEIEEYEVFQINDKRFSFLKLAKRICSFTGRIVKKIWVIILSIINFLSSVKRETYVILFKSLVVTGCLALLTFAIYKIVMFIIANIWVIIFIILVIFLLLSNLKC